MECEPLLHLLQNPDDPIIGHISSFHHLLFLHRGASPLFQRQNVRMKMVVTKGGQTSKTPDKIHRTKQADQLLMAS
jgi:hypothetical protein